MSVTFTPADLLGFHGTGQYFHHPMFKGLVYTDGVKYVSDNGCAWFVEMIILENRAQECLQREPFQTWQLTADVHYVGQIVVTDGNENQLWSKRIDFTSWPAGEPLMLWVSNGVIMVPSEY